MPHPQQVGKDPKPCLSVVQVFIPPKRARLFNTCLWIWIWDMAGVWDPERECRDSSCLGGEEGGGREGKRGMSLVGIRKWSAGRERPWSLPGYCLFCIWMQSRCAACHHHHHLHHLLYIILLLECVSFQRHRTLRKQWCIDDTLKSFYRTFTRIQWRVSKGCGEWCMVFLCYNMSATFHFWQWECEIKNQNEGCGCIIIKSSGSSTSSTCPNATSERIISYVVDTLQFRGWSYGWTTSIGGICNPSSSSAAA